MTKQEKVKYWIDLSDRDLLVAGTLADNGHYLWAGFVCHQVIEKVFKGFYSALLDETPPFKHELDILAKRGNFYDMLDEEQIAFLDILNPLNIEARYPEYINRVSNSFNKEICENLLEKTKTLQQWTKEKILLT